MLREIEEEAAAEAADGEDLEAAAQHAYERHSAAAVPPLTGFAAVGGHRRGRLCDQQRFRPYDVRREGTGRRSHQCGGRVRAGSDHGVREVIRQRRSRGWVTVRNKIIGVDS